MTTSYFENVRSNCAIKKGVSLIEINRANPLSITPKFRVSPEYGDLAGITRAIVLSRATMRNIRQNLVFAFAYNVIGIPIAAGVLYPNFGLLLSPIIAALAMSLSSVSVIGNALRLRTLKL
jgi:hypothetical protein